MMLSDYIFLVAAVIVAGTVAGLILMYARATWITRAEADFLASLVELEHQRIRRSTSDRSTNAGSASDTGGAASCGRR